MKLQIEPLKKAVKNKHNWPIFVIVLIGIALLCFPTGRKSDQKEAAKTEVATEVSTTTDLETRLSAILTNVEGAGQVSVMITYASGSEKAIAYDTTQEEDVTGQNREQKQAVVSGGEAVVLKENTPAIRGVLVVADGADEAAVKLKLTEAVKTVLGVETYQVTVLKKG